MGILENYNLCYKDEEFYYLPQCFLTQKPISDLPEMINEYANYLIIEIKYNYLPWQFMTWLIVGVFKEKKMDIIKWWNKGIYLKYVDSKGNMTVLTVEKIEKCIILNVKGINTIDCISVLFTIIGVLNKEFNSLNILYIKFHHHNLEDSYICKNESIYPLELLAEYLNAKKNETTDRCNNRFVRIYNIISGKELSKTVFLSYNTKDKYFVKKIKEDLESNGITVWFDDDSINVGNTIIDEIQKAIINADFFCVVLSKNSIKSNWVRKELTVAIQSQINYNKIILPILLETVEMPPFLDVNNYADFRGYTDREKYENSFARLLKAIKE